MCRYACVGVWGGELMGRCVGMGVGGWVGGCVYPHTYTPTPVHLWTGVGVYIGG